MVAPQAVRDIAGVVGVLLVLTAYSSVIGTLIVPRSVTNWLTRKVDQLVRLAFLLVTKPMLTPGTKLAESDGSRPDVAQAAALSFVIQRYRTRDRVESAYAPALILAQLIAWLGIFFVGFALIFWPLVPGGITAAFHTAGPALWEIGTDQARGALQQTILDIAAITGIITVTLQIAYLPTLYSAFNRREQEVALLNARAGVPSWGPELLARTHYALGSGVSTIDTLPDLYESWERWAADVAESHTTYLPLVRFRSPRPLSSWATALLAVLDSAALILVLAPSQAPTVAARLCLRSGFLCFNEVARAMRFAIPEEPDPSRGISLTYEEFLDAIARMRSVDFPVERSAEEAWPDFVGWRVNYEQAAYAIADEIDAVPALWSGPRRGRICPQIPPFRPPEGRVKKKAG